MGNTLKMDKIQQIKTLIGLGWSDRAIHRETGRDREAIAKYRGQFQNRPKVPTEEIASELSNRPNIPPGELPPPPPTNSTNLFPHIVTVRNKFLQHYTAQRIYQDLVESHDYKGSYDSVKRYIRRLKKKHNRYRERLPHLPGREAQVDFGKTTCFVRINGRYKRVWVFKMTLSCSKHAYEELVVTQDMETFIRCHERAFIFFGGVPEIVTLDNLKAAVLQANLYDPIINRTYLAFATHWGFASNPCKPYTPEHKGVVERDVGYTKHNALQGKRFESIEDGNLALKAWNKRWARTRIHGTTKCQVWKLFCDLERPVLKPLAQDLFVYFKAGVRVVGVDGLVEVAARYYAVPPSLLGKTAVVHFNQYDIKIFQGWELLITHRCLLKKGKVSIPFSCKPKWKHPSLESQERYYYSEARKIGPNMHNLVYKVLNQSDTDPLAIRRVRGYLSLVKSFGSPTVEEAAYKVVDGHAGSYHKLRSVCELLASGKELVYNPTQTHELIRPLEEYDVAISERSL